MPIAVLGGGVAGASVALHLAKLRRRDVTVYDPGRPATSTERALGGFRTQHGSRLNVELALRSREFFVSRAGRIGFQSNGYLYLADDEAAAAELAVRAEFQVELGLPIEHPEPRSKVPFLEPDGYLGTNFCALDGVYLPPLVHRAMVEEAEELGVIFRGEAAPPEAVEQADAVVVAAGTWSPELGRSLGVELKVEALERSVFMAGPFDWLPNDLPMTLEAGSGYHFRERDRMLWVMGPGDQRDWSHFRTWLERRAPAAAQGEPTSHWTGSYEVSFDHHGLVGETERSGVWACCGFSGHGVMQSPAVGAALAAMIVGETPPVDISALSPLRTEPLLDRTQL
ncbi:MAG TPA: FAD-binding oxidoreductase [Candidatus Dormibacteraeota bacterium]|nr:FAD-binding oxidoreductase [Candidatus Dormibacteraeota bacterium]